jgi:hypothetical protein
MLMRYEANNCLCAVNHKYTAWGKINRSFAVNASGTHTHTHTHTHTKLPCCKQLINTQRYSHGLSKVATSCQPTASQPTQLMASPCRAVGENEKDGREPSRRDAKRLGGVSGRRRECTGIYAKQFNSLLCGLCLCAISLIQAVASV